MKELFSTQKGSTCSCESFWDWNYLSSDLSWVILHCWTATFKNCKTPRSNGVPKRQRAILYMYRLIALFMSPSVHNRTFFSRKVRTGLSPSHARSSWRIASILVPPCWFLWILLFCSICSGVSYSCIAEFEAENSWSESGFWNPMFNIWFQPDLFCSCFFFMFVPCFFQKVVIFSHGRPALPRLPSSNRREDLRRILEATCSLRWLFSSRWRKANNVKVMIQHKKINYE